MIKYLFTKQQGNFENMNKNNESNSMSTEQENPEFHINENENLTLMSSCRIQDTVLISECFEQLKEIKLEKR